MNCILGKQFHDVQVDCPYGLPFTAVYRQAHFGSLPDRAMGLFLEAGFRRNGNYLYTMACPDCKACVPIRIAPKEFQPNRGQRRVRARNQDLSITIAPLKITAQKLALCDKFLQTRFPGKASSGLDYYAGFFINSLGSTYELEFRCQEHLLGVSIIDIYPESINCVYFYFDPAEGRRSPGTFNILTLIGYALTYQMRYVYLGYWIEEIAAMRYKTQFNPHYLLQDGAWQKQPHPNKDRTP